MFHIFVETDYFFGGGGSLMNEPSSIELKFKMIYCHLYQFNAPMLNKNISIKDIKYFIILLCICYYLI